MQNVIPQKELNYGCIIISRLFRNINVGQFLLAKCHPALSPDITLPAPPPTTMSPPTQVVYDQYNTVQYLQRNGQRIYGGPPEGWKGPPPSR